MRGRDISKEIKEVMKLLDEIDTVIIHGIQAKDSLPHQAVMKVGELRGRAVAILRKQLKQQPTAVIKEIIEPLEKAINMLVAGDPVGYSQQRLYEWIDQALTRLKQQPPAGDFTKLWRERLENAVSLYKMGKSAEEWFQSIVTGFREACDIIDSAESINADLLKVLKIVQKILQTKSEIHRPEPLVKPTWVCLKEADYTELEIILVAAIEKAKKEG